MVCYRGALIMQVWSKWCMYTYIQLSMIATSPLLCFPRTWRCEVPVGQKGDELGKGIIIAKAELWTGLWIRFAMHLVNIKLHNCRKSTIKSNTGSTKLHDCGDISLCWGVSRPAISTFVTGEGKSGSAAVHTKQYCSAWAVDRHARALRFHYSINKLSFQYLSSSSSNEGTGLTIV